MNVKHHTKNDFHGLDAYLERKQIEKGGMYLTFGNYSDDKTGDEDQSYLEHRISNVLNRADTRLHLSDNNYLNDSTFSTQNKGNPKLLSGQYQEIFKSLYLKIILLNHLLFSSSFFEQLVDVLHLVKSLHIKSYTCDRYIEY